MTGAGCRITPGTPICTIPCTEKCISRVKWLFRWFMATYLGDRIHHSIRYPQHDRTVGSFVAVKTTLPAMLKIIFYRDILKYIRRAIIWDGVQQNHPSGYFFKFSNFLIFHELQRASQYQMALTHLKLDYPS